MKKKKGLIIFDLDNTLVDKNTVFEEAQRKMIEIMKGEKSNEEDMRILREMDSILIRKYESHVYPFKILALSLWWYYHGNTGLYESVQESVDIFWGSPKGAETQKAMDLAEKAAAAHNSILENTPAPLYEGVKEVLHILRKRGYFLVLLSEGSDSLQKKTLETHGLSQYFDEIELCTRKDINCFLNVKERFSSGNSQVIVVGDGIERDIEPGNKIGAVTVWKPGDFNPGTPSPGMKQPDYTIKDIRLLSQILH